jgi:hexokinase
MIEFKKGVKAMLIEVPDYLSISQNFARELSLASQGKTTSVPFIKNILPEYPLVQSNQIFQTFVIGGTYGVMVVVKLNEDKKFAILKQKTFTPLPKFATKDDFLAFIEANLDPQTAAIGINFAYNLIPVVGEMGELDGIMNQGDTKGHAFQGLQQEQVGKTITAYLKETTNRDIVTTVANDSVCLITSGLEKDTDRENLIATIAGTGYNIAIFLDNNTVVNLQASDFTGFTQTSTGKVVDSESKNTGEQLYNKEVAAGDLFKHYNVLIPLLHLKTPPLQLSEELSWLAQKGIGIESQVARELLERSASLIAAQLAGIYIFKGRPLGLTCITQGSLFLKGSDYISNIQSQLETLGVSRNAFEFKKIKNSDVLGVIKLITGINTSLMK